MKKEIEIEYNAEFFDVEYIETYSEPDETVGYYGGTSYQITRITVRIIYQNAEDIIVLYDENEVPSTEIDATEKSKIDVEYFTELLIEKLK